MHFYLNLISKYRVTLLNTHAALRFPDKYPKKVFGITLIISDSGPVCIHPARGHLEVPDILLRVPAEAAPARRAQEGGRGRRDIGHHGAAAGRGQR